MEDKQGRGHYSHTLSPLSNSLIKKKKKRLGSRQLVLCLDTTKKRIRKMTKGPKYDQISTLPVTVFGNAFKDQLKGPIIG